MEREDHKKVGRYAQYGVFTLLVVALVLCQVSPIAMFHPGSLLLVLSGTLLAVGLQCSFADLVSACKLCFENRQQQLESIEDRVQRILNLARAVRSDGLLVLERIAPTVGDTFLKRGLELVADGHPTPEIERMLREEMRLRSITRKRAIVVLEALGQYAPAMGLIGTILGLVSMFSQLSQVETMGAALSVALMTTLYGSLLANCICLPLAGRMDRDSESSQLLRSITLEGVLGIAHQENPLSLAQRLELLLEATFEEQAKGRKRTSFSADPLYSSVNS